MACDGCQQDKPLSSVFIGRFLLSLCSTCKIEVEADPITAALGLEHMAAVERDDGEEARQLENLMIGE